MKRLILVLVLCWLIFACWQHHRHSSLVSSGDVREGRLTNGVCSVSASIYRWVRIPYTNESLRCLGGKANFNVELDKAEHGVICPFGPVSRNIGKDLPRYSARITVPITKFTRQVRYESPTNGVESVCYESKGTNTVAVLLTVCNIMTRMENLEVVELKGAEEMEKLFKPLKEWECVVVFADAFIAVRNKDEPLFRGYRLKDEELDSQDVNR